MKTLDQIAAELQGYDPQALSAGDVNEFLAQLVEPVREHEQVGIFDALGRVLAADVVSPVNVPPHDNSAMDGYAFAGDALSNQSPLTLKIIGTALAGAAWRGKVQPGECLKIMTGAVLPAGLDTVIPQEFVHEEHGVNGTHITIPPGLLQRGDNRRAMGEDIMMGQAALLKGERLMPAALGLVASLGMTNVTVWRRLRVAYFSTGDEILSLGDAPREGAVYDSNRYTVFGLLTRLGVETIDLGVVRDEPAALEAAFTRAAAQADAIITSGGVSVGEADHTKAMMKKLAGAGDTKNADDGESMGGVAFWRIAMRPGRPMAVGRIPRIRPTPRPEHVLPDLGGKLAYSQRPAYISSYVNNSFEDSTRFSVLFGLPGNPVAVMVTFLAFVRPALLCMMGSTEAAPPLLKAQSTEAIRKKPGRTEYQRGIVSTSADGTLHVRITGNQGSGVLSSMTQANGLIVLHHGQGNVAPGDFVDVMMFDGVI
jgi:molybdopterin molybdotransferase